LGWPVEPEVIRECLAIAMQAPTGSNLQNWHWIVVTDADRGVPTRLGSAFVAALRPTVMALVALLLVFLAGLAVFFISVLMIVFVVGVAAIYTRSTRHEHAA
jgi:nitroreductase